MPTAAARLETTIQTAQRLSARYGRDLDGRPNKRYRIYLIKTVDGWQPVLAGALCQPPSVRRRDEY